MSDETLLQALDDAGLVVPDDSGMSYRELNLGDIAGIRDALADRWLTVVDIREWAATNNPERHAHEAHARDRAEADRYGGYDYPHKDRRD